MLAGLSAKSPAASSTRSQKMGGGITIHALTACYTKANWVMSGRPVGLMLLTGLSDSVNANNHRIKKGELQKLSSTVQWHELNLRGFCNPWLPYTSWAPTSAKHLREFGPRAEVNPHGEIPHQTGLCLKLRWHSGNARGMQAPHFAPQLPSVKKSMKIHN